LLETLNGGMQGKRVVFTSTSAAVDRTGRPRGPLNEKSPCTPRTAYGRTKLAGERVLQDWCAREGAHFTIARLTTLYGPGVRTGMVPVLADGLRERRLSARLNWPGRASMLFVEDAVKLLLFLAECEQAADQVFFLSSGEAIQISDLVRRLADADPALPRPISLPGWFWGLARRVAWLPGVNRLVPWRLLHILDDGLWCDNSKVKKLCPFDLVQLDEGLRRTLRPITDSATMVMQPT
jgi:nucleoside-diphosphate-sugar epimerase